MTVKQISDGKEVRDLPVHLPACVLLLLNVKVLPELQVLDSVLLCCSSSVATYHLHLYIVGKEKSHLILIVAFLLLFLNPAVFKNQILLLLFQLSASKGKRKPQGNGSESYI